MKISNEKLKFSSQVEFKTVIEVKNEDCKKEDVNYTPKKTDDKINGVVDKAKDDIKIETLKVEVKEEGYEVITIDSDDGKCCYLLFIAFDIDFVKLKTSY